MYTLIVDLEGDPKYQTVLYARGDPFFHYWYEKLDPPAQEVPVICSGVKTGMTSNLDTALERLQRQTMVDTYLRETESRDLKAWFANATPISRFRILPWSLARLPPQPTWRHAGEVWAKVTGGLSDIDLQGLQIVGDNETGFVVLYGSFCHAYFESRMS